MSDSQKKVLIVALVIHVILARLTWLDLGRRPDVSVRGPKRLWRSWSILNSTGSIAYWLVGRRGGPGGEIETELI